jgi:ADP-ribose pyrophosphatase YjhB (NUDIX family)
MPPTTAAHDEKKPAPAVQETLDPILVKTLIVDNSHATLPQGTYKNIKFWNVRTTVTPCPPFRWSSLHQAFVRQARIARIANHDKHVQKNSLTWPVHPTGTFYNSVLGEMKTQQLGAIIAIQSSDNRILMVRNGRKWGLPKGARNFVEFSAALKALAGSSDAMVLSTLVLQTPETAEENIMREVLEETGLVLEESRLRPVMLDRNRMHKHPYARFVYKLPHPSSHLFHGECIKAAFEAGLMDHENDEMRWIPIYDVIDMVQTSSSLLQHQQPPSCGGGGRAKRARSNVAMNVISLAFLKDLFITSQHHYSRYARKRAVQQRPWRHYRIFRGKSSANTKM